MNVATAQRPHPGRRRPGDHHPVGHRPERGQRLRPGLGSRATTPTFALIGVAAYIARRHLEAIRDVSGTLVACCDVTDSVGILDSYFPGTRFFTDGAELPFPLLGGGASRRRGYWAVSTPRLRRVPERAGFGAYVRESLSRAHLGNHGRGRIDAENAFRAEADDG